MYQLKFPKIVLLMSAIAIQLWMAKCQEKPQSRCQALTTMEKYKTCYCENDDLNFKSWSIECPDEYKITNMVNKFIEVTCFNMDQSPLEEDIFLNLNITDPHHFKLNSCPASNVTLDKVLAGMTVFTLKIELPTTYEFPDNYFQGLESLKHLRLSRSQIKELPSDLFQNLTNLESLQLNENRLVTLPEGLFDNLKNLEMLQLSGNKLEKFPVDIFRNLTKLKLLYLYKNNLKEIPIGLFDNLTALTTVDLTNNELTMLESATFDFAPNLKHINLMGNNLEALPSGLFKNNKQLSEVILSSNTKLKYLADDLFSDLPNLLVVKMRDCFLTSIPDNLFSNCTSLNNVSLINNRLSSLHENAFLNTDNLVELDLSYNNLSEIPINLFKRKLQLQSLSISNNNLRELRVGVFNDLTNLEKLHLNGNQLEFLNTSVMRPLNKLRELKVTKNKIRELVGSQPFGYSTGLTKVDLSFNNLSDLSLVNWNLHLLLSEIYLNNNNFSYISIPRLIAQEWKMTLKNNQISYVDLREIEAVTGKGEPNKGHVFLEGNKLNCDCKLLKFVQYVKKDDTLVTFEDLRTVKCKPDEEGNDTMVLTKEPEKFTCPFETNCTSSCKCDYRALDRAVIVQCLNLTDLPSKLPHNSTEVYLQSNQISNLTGLQDDMWENVKTLILDNNNVTSAEWDWPPNLKVLSLQNNQIEWLGDQTFDYVTSKDNDFQLYLGNNPFYCDCATKILKDFLQTNSKKIGDLEAIYCANEVYQNGTTSTPRVVKLTDELCPQENEIKNAYLITISIVCVVLAISLFIVSVLYYRNKQMLTAYIYIHFYRVFVCLYTEEELDEDKTFDAFVSYSSADRDVALALMKELEESDPKFKLCIHERDWLPGNLITWNIANSVQNSRKTILVLSQNFLESLWFQIEFHTAYYQMLEDRIDRLIVIVKGELPKKETLDKELQFLLSTKTYLVWGERWFWEKLRFALPHHRTLPENERLALRQRPNSTLLKTVEDKIASLAVTNENNDKRDNKLSNGIYKNGNAAYINSSLTMEDENKPKSIRNNYNKSNANTESLENAINLQELKVEVPMPPVRPKRSPQPILRE